MLSYAELRQPPVLPTKALRFPGEVVSEVTPCSQGTCLHSGSSPGRRQRGPGCRQRGGKGKHTSSPGSWDVTCPWSCLGVTGEELSSKSSHRQALTFMSLSFCPASSLTQNCLQRQTGRKSSRRCELLWRLLFRSPIHLFSHSWAQSVLYTTCSCFQPWNKTIPQHLCRTALALIRVGRSNYRDYECGAECQGILKLFNISK